MLDDLDKPLVGADTIARVLGLSKRQAFHCLERGYVPAVKLGRKWVSTRRRLLGFLNGEKPEIAA
jgi:hypothetical protein